MRLFQSTTAQASCNYCIGRDGTVGLCVEETDRSWCSSSPDNDNRAVTIECASDAKDPYAVNGSVYEALLDLCEDICRRNGKRSLLWLESRDRSLSYVPKADEMVLTVHRWFKNKACPGDYLMGKMPEIAREVTRRLQEVPEVVFKTIEEMPAVYRPTIQKLVDRGAIKGTADGLDLTRNMVRLLVFIDRAGVFDFGSDSR